jgi:hypothetical protein
MDRDRALELAIEALQTRKAQIDAEIEMIQAELSGSEKAISTKSVITDNRRERSRTTAQRKAQSQRMKERWAEKKAKEVKAEKPTPLSPTPKKATSNSINNAIQAFLEKKKAGTAQTNAKAKPTGNKIPKKPSKA